MKLPFGFQILAGFRYDHAANDDELVSRLNQAHDAVSPRYGLLWRPIPEVSLYGSYVENFGSPHEVFHGGANETQVLPPETAQQWEVGVKPSSSMGG